MTEAILAVDSLRKIYPNGSGIEDVSLEVRGNGIHALLGQNGNGKSTLANALAGSQVAAVSPRPQTTRRRITAVVHGDGWQAVMLDLPGFQRPADGLTARMQEEARIPPR